MNKKIKEENYTDYISKIYREVNEELDYFTSRNVTFQITDDCPMSCTYCYYISTLKYIVSAEY